MPLQQLLHEIDAIPWFTNLGGALSSSSSVVVCDLPQWQQLITVAALAEFGLPHDEGIFSTYPFTEMSWLPTSHGEDDPVHGDSLMLAARSVSLESDFIAARLAATKAAAKSQRLAYDHPALTVGSSNLTEAARSGGQYACRMAAAETCLGQTGFWCNAVQIYRQGNWPFGILPGDKLLVL